MAPLCGLIVENQADSKNGDGGDHMTDPAAITLIASALPAAVTFFFQRVERLIGSRGAEPEANVSFPEGLAGSPRLPLQPDGERLRDRRRELELLRAALSHYASGAVPARPGDQQLLQTLDRSREALEDIYGQHLTFEGEDRPVSGASVRQKLKTVSGEVTGMDVEEILGEASVVQDVETVEPGANLIGMKGRNIAPQ